MTRIEDRLRATLDHYAAGTTIDDEAFEALERRRTHRRLAGWPLAFGLAAAGVAAVAAVAVLTATTETASPDPLAPGGATVDEAWEDLTLAEALDRLIALNEARPAPAPLAPGQERVARVVGAAIHQIDGEDGLETYRYVAEEEWRYTAAGTARVGERIIADTAPITETLADLQQRVAADAGGTIADLRPADLSDRAAMLEAEALSHGSAEPTPGRTERPDQAYAFMRMMDAFRFGATAPTDVIEGLRIIERLDASLVEYRGPVEDLLGRPAIAIGGYDLANDSWNFVLFDPQNGAFVGEFDEYHRALEGFEGLDLPVLGNVGALVSDTVEPAA